MKTRHNIKEYISIMFYILGILVLLGLLFGGCAVIIMSARRELTPQGPPFPSDPPVVKSIPASQLKVVRI